MVKEVIHCKSCTLYPPSPTAPVPTTRERPPGCRTVFVGGVYFIYNFRFYIVKQQNYILKKRYTVELG